MVALLASLLDMACTFNEAFWLWKYIDLLYERRARKGLLARERWLVPGIQMGCFMVIVMAMNHFVQLVSPYTLHILLVQGVMIACLFWKCDLWNAVAVVGGYLFLNGAVGATEVSLTGVIGGDILIQQTTAERGWSRVIYHCICGPIWYGLNYLIYGLVRKKKINTASLKYLAYLSVIGLLGFTYFFSQMLSGFDIQINVVWYVFLFFIFFGILVSYYKIKTKQMLERMRTLDNQNRMLESNYGKISMFYHENAKLQHDISHHLTAIIHMLDEGKAGEARQYIVSLKNPVSSFTIKIRTGIDVVDVVLSEMEQRAAEKGIPVAMHIQMLPEELPIEKRDLCALFANLMENAVESAEKEISIALKVVNSMLLIQMRNDYKVEPVWKAGRLLSRKENSAYHGYGTQSVEYVVQKYHGSIEYKVQEGVFGVDIIMNI